MTSHQKLPVSASQIPGQAPGALPIPKPKTEEAGALIYAVDPQGRILRFNAACERLTGFSYEDLHLDLFWERLIPAEIRLSTQTMFLNMVSSQQIPAQLTLEWQTRLGERRLLVWGNQVIRNSSGAIQQIVSIGQDITSQAALNDRISVLTSQIENYKLLDEQIFSSIPVGLAVYRPDGACVQVNEAACRIAHTTREKLLSQNFRQLNTWKQNGLLQAANQVLSGGQPQAVEIHQVATFGSEVWLMCRLSSFPFNGQPHLMLISEDIADQRRAEEQLRQKAEQQAFLAELSQYLVETAAGPDRLLEVAARQIGSRLGEMCLLTAIDEDRQTIQPIAFYHADSGIRAIIWSMLCSQPTRIGEGYLGETLQAGRPGLLVDLNNPEQIGQILERYQPLLERAHLHSLYAVPLRGQGQVVGGLVIGRSAQSRPFSSEDQSLIQLIADRTALAFTNARLYAENLRHKVELEQSVANRTVALDQNEKTLRSLLDAIPEFAFLIAPDGRLISGNQSLAHIIGQPVEKLPGLNLFDVLPSQNTTIQKAAIERVVQTKAPLIFEDRGQDLVMSNRAYPVFGPDGEVESLAFLSINITEQQHLIQDLRDREERFRAIFEQAAVGITLTSTDEHYLRVNQRFCELVGYSEAELLERTFSSITHPDDLAENKVLCQRVLQREINSFTLEKRYLRKDDCQIWVNLTVNLVRDPAGQPAYFVSIIEDVSERKRAQTLLEDRTRELARSNADLEQFAYIASHDLQEPLRVITGFSQLIAKRYKGKLDSEADEFINFITDGVKHMQRLIEDLLAYSLVGRRSRPFTPVELAHVLAQACENLQLRIEKSGAILTHDDLPVVVGDETLLVQLMQNLIENSIKFRSDETPHIHISARQKAGEWQVSVRDNGIGIKPQYFDRIFIIFQRLHLREDYPGTGLGLAICKKIVERHGGRIWLESEFGHGSTFFFSIPDQAAKEPGKSTPASGEPA